MRIFKLEPIDRTSQEWQYSDYPNDQYPLGIVIVRAENSDSARGLAASTFSRRVRGLEKYRGERIEAGPWQQASLVSAVEVDSSGYEKEKRGDDEAIIGTEETLQFLKNR